MCTLLHATLVHLGHVVQLVRPVLPPVRRRSTPTLLLEQRERDSQGKGWPFKCDSRVLLALCLNILLSPGVWAYPKS